MEPTNKVLYENLEKILFKEARLISLKEGINKVAMGKISVRDFKDQFFKAQMQILKELFEFFPFYNKGVNATLALNSFTDKKETSPDLEERNKFLKEIGIRIQRIYDKLKKSP